MKNLLTKMPVFQSVDSITAGFTDMLKQLDGLMARHDKQIDKAIKLEQRIVSKREALINEHQRAEKVRSKIAELLS